MKIRTFWKSTKVISRILFIIWLSFTGICALIALSPALTLTEFFAITFLFSSFFLIPAILIEYKKNPFFTGKAKQKPYLRHFIFGIILLEISPFITMGGILGILYSYEEERVIYLIPLVLSLFLFAFGILQVNGFITKQSIKRKEARKIRQQKENLQQKAAPIKVKVHISNPTHKHSPSVPVKGTHVNTPDISITDGMDGHDFEYFCADLLKMNGFTNVSVTPGSGDQGVDVLATKEGIKYAIQCKCYLTPLGNKPVQEVNAGKTFYGCHVGVVMTNSTFTPGAFDLAKATNILLWDRVTVKQMMANCH